MRRRFEDEASLFGSPQTFKILSINIHFPFERYKKKKSWFLFDFLFSLNLHSSFFSWQRLNEKARLRLSPHIHYNNKPHIHRIEPRSSYLYVCMYVCISSFMGECWMWGIIDKCYIFFHATQRADVHCRHMKEWMRAQLYG